MQNGIDWKAKYKELKARYLESMDMSFRLGYEKGGSDAQIQQAQTQMQEAQQMQAQAQQSQMQMQAQQPQPGQEDPNAEMPQDQMPPEMEQQDPNAPMSPDMQPEDPNAPMSPDGMQPDQGQDFDQSIAELEDLVSKSEGEAKNILTKSLVVMKDMSLQSKLKKMHALPARAAANLSPQDKKALSIQEGIIDNMMKKWDEESVKTTAIILRNIEASGLSKKE